MATSSPQRQDQFELYPGRVGEPNNGTSASSRLGLTDTSSGDVTIRFPQTHFRGISQVETAIPFVESSILGFTGVFQDTDATLGVSDSEGFGYALLREDPANPGQPDGDPTTELLRFSSPPGSTIWPQSLSGSVDTAVEWTVTFATPVRDMPLFEDVFVAMQVYENPAPRVIGDAVFPQVAFDQSVLGAPQGTAPSPLLSPGTFGHSLDRTGQPGAIVPAQPLIGLNALLHVALLTESRALKLSVGAGLNAPPGVTPPIDFGLGGLFQDHGSIANGRRRDAIVLRTSSTSPVYAGQNAFTLLSVGPSQSNLIPFLFEGFLLVDLTPGVFVPSFILPATLPLGVGESVYGAPGGPTPPIIPLPAFPVQLGTMTFQSFVFDPPSGAFVASNSVTAFDA